MAQAIGSDSVPGPRRAFSLLPSAFPVTPITP